MRVKVKLFDKTLPVPTYQTNGAGCVDLYARVATEIQPNSVGHVPLNIALELPEGYWALVAARSSTHKQGLMPANGIGICDWDFRGDDDEYHFPLYNFTNGVVTVAKGQRMAQLMIMPVEKIDFDVVEKLEGKNRGKFGTTGN